MSPCKHDVFVGHSNIGTDAEPKLMVLAECDGSDNGANASGCGWSVEHLDQDGDPHEVGDWWITSDQMTEYVGLHQAFAQAKKDEEKQ